MLDMDVNTLPRIYFDILKMFGICWNSTSFGRRKCAHDLGTGQKARLPWWKAWFLTSEGIPLIMKSMDSDFFAWFGCQNQSFWVMYIYTWIKSGDSYFFAWFGCRNPCFWVMYLYTWIKSGDSNCFVRFGRRNPCFSSLKSGLFAWNLTVWHGSRDFWPVPTLCTYFG